ncbi:MAG: outer membrane beta-barrel protein [Gammaproteobacteria bacterium]|nr:outer membrane beta-barrel protein [Gammaproteobacteria bacterium]
MNARYKSIAITVSILALVTSAVSCNAANWFPFYAVGGMVKTEMLPISFVGSSPGDGPTVVASKDTDTTFHLGGGYSFNETWSVEASYVVGPTQERTLRSEFEIPGGVFTSTADIAVEVTIYRACAVYELPFRDPISFIGKVGIAHVKAESKFSTRGGAGLPGFSFSDSEDETKAFAATGVRVSFMEKRAAASLTFVSYQDLPQLESALEVDFMWRF